MVSGSFWVKLAQGNHLCNVGPWQTDNVYEENNLYNVVSTMLGQHCIKMLSSQCCPRTSETTLHQIITFAMLAQSVQTSFRLKNFARFAGKYLCQSLFFNKVTDLRPATLFKKRLWHRCFSVHFVKFLRIPFLQNTSGRLLLHRKIIYSMLSKYV